MTSLERAKFMKRITLSILIAVSRRPRQMSIRTRLRTPPVRQVSQPNEPGRTGITSNTENAGGDQSMLEMVFVLDTTGSMGGLIDGAKQRIWGIIKTFGMRSNNSSQPRRL